MTARAAKMWLCCAAMLSLTLSGCLNLNKSYPEKRSFVLDVGSGQQPPAADASAVLRISRLRVSPLFAGRAMVYRVGELQYDNDFYNEWLVPPSVLLTQQFQGWLSKSSRFRFVLSGMNHVEPTHVLDGTVTEFYGDYRAGGSPHAVLGMEVMLIDDRKDEAVVFRRTYRQEVPLAGRSPDALAAGLSQAARQVLVDLDRDLGGVPLEPSPRSR